MIPQNRDPSFRDRFFIQDGDVVYLDGNSLGRLPLATKMRMREIVESEWGNALIASWNQSWLPLSRRIGDKIGSLIGARVGETIVCDSTSINLYKAAWALLQHRGVRKTIVTDMGNFPTDLYVLEGLRSHAKMDLRVVSLSFESCDHDTVHAMLSQTIDDDTALLCLSHVNYKSGYAFDLNAVTALAHRHGVPVLWDLSHSVGAIPVDLGAAKADAAVGCTYKYLNGGPGAPAFLTIRTDWIEKLQCPIRGWFGASRPFDFSPDYEPSPSIDRFAVGTPPILSLAAVEPGVELTREAGIVALRERGWQLMLRFFSHYEHRLASLGYRLVTPTEKNATGSHVSLSHPHAWQITQDLVQRYRVVPDFRGPNIIRFGVTPLYTLEREIDAAVDALESSVTQSTYASHPQERIGVT